MPATFFDLPLELKLMIKRNLELWDLRNSVCLYLADPRLRAALYGREKDSGEFWELVCWKNGIGRLPSDMQDDNMWFQIAVECFRLDGFCQHPYCGESFLKHNRRCMQECAEHTEQFSPVYVTEAYHGDVTFAPNTILYHINFRPKRERRTFEEHEVEEDAHLRVATSSRAHGEGMNPENAAANRAYIGQHPIAARSFVTATPMSNIFLLNIVGWFKPGDPTLTLERPVTVLDLLKLMHKEDCMTVKDVYEHVDSHVECIEQEGWGVTDAFENLQRLLGILELCPISFMDIAEWTDHGPAISFSL